MDPRAVKYLETGGAPDAFADAAAAPDIASLKRDLPPRLVDRVAARATRCAQLVT
jgi:hypothetical protein